MRFPSPILDGNFGLGNAAQMANCTIGPFYNATSRTRYVISASFGVNWYTSIRCKKSTDGITWADQNIGGEPAGFPDNPNAVGAVAAVDVDFDGRYLYATVMFSGGPTIADPAVILYVFDTNSNSWVSTSSTLTFTGATGWAGGSWLLAAIKASGDLVIFDATGDPGFGTPASMSWAIFSGGWTIQSPLGTSFASEVLYQPLQPISLVCDPASGRLFLFFTQANLLTNVISLYCLVIDNGYSIVSTALVAVVSNAFTGINGAFSGQVGRASFDPISGNVSITFIAPDGTLNAAFAATADAPSFTIEQVSATVLPLGFNGNPGQQISGTCWNASGLNALWLAEDGVTTYWSKRTAPTVWSPPVAVNTLGDSAQFFGFMKPTSNYTTLQLSYWDATEFYPADYRYYTEFPLVGGAVSSGGALANKGNYAAVG